jgi:hypothetical protein
VTTTANTGEDVPTNAEHLSAIQNRSKSRRHSGGDCWIEALEALRVARAASWSRSAETQALWNTVEDLEAGLCVSAETLVNLANKLRYLLTLSTPPNRSPGQLAGGSWKLALLASAIADAERLSSATSNVLDQRYQALLREYRRVQRALEQYDSDSTNDEAAERLRQELANIRAERDSFE